MVIILNNMPLQTYTYKRTTYYVDYRNKQFRTVDLYKPIRFHGFDDPYGDLILAKMIRDGVADEAKLNF